MIVVDDVNMYEEDSEPENEEVEKDVMIEGDDVGNEASMFLVVRRILSAMLVEENENVQRENLVLSDG